MKFNLSRLNESAVDLGELKSSFSPPQLTTDEIEKALMDPVSSKTLFEMITPSDSVCIVVSDNTRKTAIDKVFPSILKGLRKKNIPLKNISVLIASGIHRHPGTDEIRSILGEEAFAEFKDRIVIHNPDDKTNLVSVGTTKRGHDVRINRRVVEADKLILTGTATYHYHAGFGGGRKSLVPGCAARDTIAYNHSLTLDPNADRIHPGVEIGKMDGNPVAEEMLEGAKLCQPDMIINTVLSPDGKLVGLFCGDLEIAHRKACELTERICGIDIKEPADLVIASSEGAKNWIQSHKGLFAASRAVKENGTIILYAPCPEGIGDERFRYWIKKPSTKEIYSELRKTVEVLGQTALSTKIRGAKTLLVTGMNQTDKADLGIQTTDSIDSAIDIFLKKHRSSSRHKPTFYLMPHARYTVPFIK